MSAPDTNLEKQTKRHRPAIYGIAIAVLLFVIFLATAILWPGVPLDEQAAADGVATEVVEEDDDAQ